MPSRHSRTLAPSHLRAVIAATVVLTSAAAFAADRREEVTRSFNRNVTVTGTPTLRVEHRNGDVRVRAHAGNELQVRATIHVSAGSRAEAADLADRIVIDIQAGSIVIAVVTRYPFFRAPNRDLSYSVDYDLLVPERLTLDIRNRFGDIVVNGMKAGGSLTNGSGKVTVTDGAGLFQLENTFGPIEAARLSGDLVIRSANGSVSATTVTGAVNVTNRFGSVNASTIRGDTYVSNQNGTVGASGISGRADLRTTFGAVDFRDVGTVSASSANGSVTGTNVNGNATVTASFGAVMLRNVGGDTRVTNMNGPVTVEGIRGGADLSTRYGRIDALTVKGGLRVSSANGPVKVLDVDGAVYLKTSFGTVDAERVRGALTVDNTSGGVNAVGIGGPATVSSSFGPVVVRDVDGRVDIRNRSGSVEAWPTARPGSCHDVALNTSFSAMEVHLPDAGYSVEARTTFGQIRADVPITATGTIGGNMVAGRIGPGGCLLRLVNTSGDIRILKAQTRTR